MATVRIRSPALAWVGAVGLVVSLAGCTLDRHGLESGPGANNVDGRITDVREADDAPADLAAPVDTGVAAEAGSDGAAQPGTGGAIDPGTGGGAGNSDDGGGGRSAAGGAGGSGGGSIDPSPDAGVGGAGVGGASNRDAAPEGGPDGSDAAAPPDVGVAAVDAAHGNCPPPLLFCDDFDDGVPDGWNAFEQNVGATGIWSVAPAVGHLGTMSFVFAQSAGPALIGYHYQYPAPLPNGGPWQDQTVTAWIRASADLGGDANKAGLCARFTSDGTDPHTSGYCLFLRADVAGVQPATGRIQFSKKLPGGALGIVPGTATVSANVPVFVPGNWYKITLRASGTPIVTLRAFANDVQLGTVVDNTNPTLSNGGPALVTRSATAAFDDVSVSTP